MKTGLKDKQCQIISILDIRIVSSTGRYDQVCVFQTHHTSYYMKNDLRKEYMEFHQEDFFIVQVRYGLEQQEWGWREVGIFKRNTRTL